MPIIIKKNGREVKFRDYLHQKKEHETIPKTLPENKIRVSKDGFAVSSHIGKRYVMILEDKNSAKLRFSDKRKSLELVEFNFASYRKTTSKYSARQTGNYYYRTDVLFLGLGKGDFNLMEDNGFFKIDASFQHDYS